MAKREATTPEPRTQGGQGPGEGLSRRLEDVEEKRAGVEGNSGNENAEGKGLEAGAAACQDCRMAFCSRRSALVSVPLVSADGSYCILIPPPPRNGEERIQNYSLYIKHAENNKQMFTAAYS